MDGTLRGISALSLASILVTGAAPNGEILGDPSARPASSLPPSPSERGAIGTLGIIDMLCRLAAGEDGAVSAQGSASLRIGALSGLSVLLQGPSAALANLPLVNAFGMRMQRL